MFNTEKQREIDRRFVQANAERARREFWKMKQEQERN
jgi:hypothetical protein